jgi:HSP20 family protein
MAVPSVRRSGSLARPGSQAAAGRWDPFAEFEDLYQRMGQLMNSPLDGAWQPMAQSWAPMADLSETEDGYVAEIELPGVKKEDVSIELTGQELQIVGEFRDNASAGRPLRRGRRTGQFEYRVLLPGQADPSKVTASLTDGVLTVTVPKAETEKPRKIEITAS